MRIRPENALYIKLGKGGAWETECIDQRQTLRIEFREASHALCVEERWDEVERELGRGAKSSGAAADWLRQVQLFYTASPNVLWVTLCRGHLWWCRSKPVVTMSPSGDYRERAAIEPWSKCDIRGTPLTFSRLSGKLLAVSGYRGTICQVREFDYLVNKINAKPHPFAKAAAAARSHLVSGVEDIVRHLHWRDFEILIDLILGQAGWRRISELGGTKDTLDLELESALTSERYGVQVKSQANAADLNTYRRRVEGRGFHRCYFIVHSPSGDLNPGSPGGAVQVLGAAQVAEWSVKYGLVDWIIDRAG